MKRLIAVFALIAILAAALCALTPAFAEPYKEYAVEENEDELFPFMQTGDFSRITGYVLIVLLGYVMPFFLIIFGLIKFLKSVSERRRAWLIMPIVGLLTAILVTVFIILTI